MIRIIVNSLIGLHFINILIILLIVIWIICSVLLKKGYLEELIKSVVKRNLNLESFNINITDSSLLYDTSDDTLLEIKGLGLKTIEKIKKAVSDTLRTLLND